MIEAVADRLEGAPRQLRRRWSDEFKARAVAEALEPGASVSAIAHRIGIHPSQLFAWRRNARTDASPQRSAGAGASVRAAAAVVEIIIGDIVVRAGADVAEALRYAISRRAMFERFLTDGRIELDSNIVERAIRPQAITRKNSLFAGSDGGGRTWATIATLLQTAKMNNVDPLAWLIQTLERIANGWPSSEIEALMPWNYAA